MNTAIVEVTNGDRNWGKFLVGQFDEVEWARRSAIDTTSRRPLLATVGWGPDVPYLLVLDLQTGEGAVFRRGGLASADLNRHAIWVCPMFEPFLDWLYRSWDGALASLPPVLDLPDAPFAMHGYRRAGPPDRPKRPKR